MPLPRLFGTPTHRIDRKIQDLVGRDSKSDLVTHSADLPGYRFADVYMAMNSIFNARPNVETVETQQSETLNQLIHEQKPNWADRSIGRSTKISWQIGPKQETYLPVDCFWLCPSSNSEPHGIGRITFDVYSQKTKVELAATNSAWGQSRLDLIIQQSKDESIFRNKLLQLSYEPGKRDEYGDIEKPETFQVVFSTIEPVTDEDIVLSAEHLDVLQRNVIDLHTRREILAANGVPARRGVLLHGPPGTGKTFACRFLCHKLPEVTRIFVTGSSLVNVGAIFSFARLMQPSVLFLEDVDLLFASREINLYSSALGDLLDQMDGLRSNETISVVLTTNAIDRLEAAIRDRPGRISQCVFMGAPAGHVRHNFLSHQLRDHDSESIDIDQLVRDSEGATQAFMKEWVRRAVQMACERLDEPSQRAAIRNDDFAKALKEMRSFLDGSEGQIIGFVGRG